MNKEQIESSIEKYFKSRVEKDPNIRNAFLFVHSDRLGIHLNLSEGVNSNPKAPYYIASIGKLFTSVVIGILVERGVLSYEDEISKYIDDDILDNLHVYKGVDYSREIKIKHLLNHTSGLHDYFSDKPKSGKPMIDIILSEPNRFWSPREAITWSKENLKSHFPPGEGFHYSDTGYLLLGLIIEKVTLNPFHTALHNFIFTPLKMDNSFLAFYSRPAKNSDYPIADLFARGKNVTNFTSLSIDYAGGGIVSTSEDLFKFMKALSNNQLVNKETFQKMRKGSGFFNLFFIGIDYGYGLMSFKTIPVLMPEKYNVWGNAGSIGSFMFYNEKLDAYLIGNLNNFGYHRKGIRLMFKVIDMLRKIE
ncbi:MAG: beta-lactamase/D-alanine carboxypeptidase [Candidatus Methanofastidiosum methylothiophilum]|uniref:Beta-lactamase/D-alanine carboxypeptidase n=1 Tax=Candidatus Methanofastidiosum methylothiophilum TaxID=1705564 RepID=A0A150IJV3_9EURY|nr:MAG: beta-lactamase/D-alanine carboxypeptidase [Candidatus Methanofastidiosum methylthiophilus]KYC48717.1 MAG: beta-lactamase/D-alanine carboxypeptidase [Candidatus Methanofastidiosum methylthiophilus]KYC51365.1 MAG: beta-lactamase/D-alanine carboxypeptidase [Candidatus Methanofastidiosum methylthiophilus]